MPGVPEAPWAVTVTPAPTSRVVPEGIVSVPATAQVWLPPLQTPERGEAGHAVEPFEVVIEMTVAARAAGASSASGERRRTAISASAPRDRPDNANEHRGQLLSLARACSDALR